jgi:hypothetical protein
MSSNPESEPELRCQPEFSAVPSFSSSNLEAGHIFRRFDRHVVAGTDGLIIEEPEENRVCVVVKKKSQKNVSKCK